MAATILENSNTLGILKELFDNSVLSGNVDNTVCIKPQKPFIEILEETFERDGNRQFEAEIKSLIAQIEKETQASEEAKALKGSPSGMYETFVNFRVSFRLIEHCNSWSESELSGLESYKALLNSAKYAAANNSLLVTYWLSWMGLSVLHSIVNNLPDQKDVSEKLDVIAEGAIFANKHLASNIRIWQDLLDWETYKCLLDIFSENILNQIEEQSARFNEETQEKILETLGSLEKVYLTAHRKSGRVRKNYMYGGYKAREYIEDQEDKYNKEAEDLAKTHGGLYIWYHNGVRDKDEDDLTLTERVELGEGANLPALFITRVPEE